MMPTPAESKHVEASWLDRAIATVAPQWQLKRTRARIADELVRRYYGYEAATIGRRTQNWNRSAGDANTVNGFASLARLREVARDLVRNNPYAENAVETIGDHTVGWGINAKPATEVSQQLRDLWKTWAESTDCDADGRHDLYGLQKLVMTAVAQDGEVLIRRRMRYLTDGFPVPLQLQVLEADFLDAFKTGPTPNGGKIVQGVEFDAIGNRVAYWLFPEHPGAAFQSVLGSMFPASRRVPASEVIHVFRSKRPGQVRAASWFAPVIVRLKDFDEYEDATLMKQKIAACLAVITTDVDGTSPSLGTKDDTAAPPVDALEPGGILNVPPGRSVEVVQPPSVTDHQTYCNVTLRAIASGLGMTYEDLTGDYTNLPFSAARMSRLRHWARVQGWRWRLLIPQFCDPAWDWFMQAAAVMGVAPNPWPAAIWTPPGIPMIEPDKEGLAISRNVRNGIQTLQDAIRERGYDVDEFLREYKEGLTKIDDLGIVLDSDPRKMTQAGQLQSAAKPTTGANA